MRKKSIVVMLCAVFSLAACAKALEPAQEDQPSDLVQVISTQEPSVQELEEKESSSQETTGMEESDFQVDLEDSFQKAAYFADMVYQKEQSNTLVSPLSLDIALGMVAEGASGRTKEELAAYLSDPYFSENIEDYLDYANQLCAQKDEGSFLVSSGYSFEYSIANSIWVNDETTLYPSYKEQVEKMFQAQVECVDFTKKVDKTVNRINSWCKDKTHGLIPEMISQGQITPELVSLLLNSIYFESPWLEKWNTRQHEFTDIYGNKTEQEMLYDTVSTYYENEFATAFSKPYYNQFMFVGILPKEEGEFSIADLQLGTLLDNDTKEYEVKAISPKLNFDTTADNIIDILKQQGVQEAFDDSLAQIDRLAKPLWERPIYISDIIQKCKIELDENGTRAAAVTAVMMKTEEAMIPDREKEVKEVYLDRPFAFMIYDQAKEKIVFLGKVTQL